MKQLTGTYCNCLLTDLKAPLTISSVYLGAVTFLTTSSLFSPQSSIRMGNLLYISNRVLSSVLLQLLQCSYLRFPKANPIFAYSSCQLACEYLPIQNLKLGSRVYLTRSSTIVKFSLVTRTISARNLKESKQQVLTKTSNIIITQLDCLLRDYSKYCTNQVVTACKSVSRTFNTP